MEGEYQLWTVLESYYSGRQSQESLQPFSGLTVGGVPTPDRAGVPGVPLLTPVQWQSESGVIANLFRFNSSKV